MSLVDLLRAEVNKQVDIVLEAIPSDFSGFPSTSIRSKWDFIYGYEYGRIVWNVISYYLYKVINKEPTDDELTEIVRQIYPMVDDRLLEIRQAISKEENKLKD